MAQEINPYDFRIVENDGETLLCFKVSYQFGSEIAYIPISRADEKIENKYYEELYKEN